MLQPGDKAPNFVLPMTGDQTFDLAQQNTPCVIFFYPKDSTPGCTVEAKDFSALKGEFENLSVKIVGVSPDTLKRHDNFRHKQELTIDLASDVEKEIVETWGVWVEKQLYGRKYMGVERSTFLVDANGDIRAAWHKVKVKGHAQAVLDKAREELTTT